MKKNAFILALIVTTLNVFSAPTVFGDIGYLVAHSLSSQELEKKCQQISKEIKPSVLDLAIIKDTDNAINDAFVLFEFESNNWNSLHKSFKLFNRYDSLELEIDVYLLDEIYYQPATIKLKLGNKNSIKSLKQALEKSQLLSNAFIKSGHAKNLIRENLEVSEHDKELYLKSHVLRLYAMKNNSRRRDMIFSKTVKAE